MLTVDGDGVIITLSGQAKDPLFWWSIVLLVCGLIVAVICFTAPVSIAIGALFLFAVQIFAFNIQRQKAKSRHMFSQGQLRLTPKRFEINNKALTLSQSATVTAKDGEITVIDRGIEYRFTGFGDVREVKVAEQLLLGKSVQANQVTIKLAET